MNLSPDHTAAMHALLTTGQWYGALSLLCSLILFGLFAWATLRDSRRERTDGRVIPIERARQRRTG